MTVTLVRPPEKRKPREPYCSFCGNTRKEGGGMATSCGVYICRKCAVMSIRVIDEDKERVG